MNIKLNGKQTNVIDGISLSSLLESLQIEPGLVACELNLKVIRRKDYAATILKEGDELEILRMIGGG